MSKHPEMECRHWIAMSMTCVLLQSSLIGQVTGDYRVTGVDLTEFSAHPKINSIVQGKYGFVWMASDHGLYRFDGVHVKHITRSDYPGLPSDKINSILVGTDGEIWIATEEGLAVFDSRYNVIHPRKLQTSADQHHEKLVPTKLFMASDSTIWIGMTNNRFGRLLAGDSVQVYTFDTDYFPLGNCYETTKILEDSRGDIFLQAICVRRVVMVHIDLNCEPLAASIIRKAEMGTTQMFALNKEIYRVDWQSLFRFNPVTRAFDAVVTDSLFGDIANFVPWAISEVGKSSVILGGMYGRLVKCHLGNTGVQMHNFGKMAEGSIQVIMQDQSGCFWLGTDDGVYIISDRNARFPSYFSSTTPGKVYGTKMRGIMEDRDGRIYACSNSGLYSFDPSTGEVLLLRGAPLVIPNVYAICPGAEDFIWVGSDGYGLIKYDIRRDTFFDHISMVSRTDELGGAWVGELVLDSDSTLWVGTGNGVSYSTGSRGRFRIATDVDGNRLLTNTFVHDIKEMGKDRFWVGTSRGLYQMISVGHFPDRHCLLNKFDDVPYKIREICLTPGSDIWLATEDAGLVHYHPESKSQDVYTASDGLPSDVLYSMLPGPKGELWMGTFNGLARFDTATRMCSKFYTTDGLPHNEFNSQSQLIASDGTFYMGTQNGMVSFRPEEFGIDSSDLPVMINGVTIHNTRVDTTYMHSSYIQLNASIDLGPHDDLVTVSYAIADFTKPDANRFQYLLEGLYTRWHNVGNRTELVLPHLPAGEYVLHIRGAGSDGRWSTQQARVTISVRAAFVNTWAFRISVLAILAGIMWMIHRYRLNQVMKLQRMRLRIAEDLHDELGSSLTGISMQTELLTASEPSAGRASRLREISGYIQDAVSKLGDIVWSLQTESGSLGDLMDRMEEQAHMLLDPADIECHFALARDSRDAQLNDVVRQNCFLIFKEAITNIVKHSKADRVDITIRRTDKEGLILSVADNGEEAPLRPSMGGNGLKNMQTRTAKMSGSLTIDKAQGFRIELVVPKAFAG